MARYTVYFWNEDNINRIKEDRAMTIERELENNISSIQTYGTVKSEFNDEYSAVNDAIKYINDYGKVAIWDSEPEAWITFED